MTEPNGPVIFNSSTGSETAASGLGPASALSGAGASTTSASAVVTGITTTGVAAGDMRWVQSSSGRQFGIIASVDSSTQVTCDDVFANTESSRTWAIGGKRATWDNTDSRRLFGADGGAGFTVETETDQTINSPIAVTVAISSGSNYFTIKGSSASSKSVITQTADNYGFNLNGADLIKFENLDMRNTSSTKTANVNWAFRPVNGTYIIKNCCAKDATSNWYRGVSTNGSGQTSLIYCEFANCVNTGADFFGQYVFAYGCYSHDNGTEGFRGGGSRQSEFLNCVSANNGSNGFLIQGIEKVVGCISYGNSQNGVYAQGIRNAVTRCLLVNNGSYGLFAGSSELIAWDGNAYYGNITAETDLAIDRPDDITLTADPFVDSSNSDFNLNSAAGGGATLRATNYTIGS